MAGRPDLDPRGAVFPTAWGKTAWVVSASVARLAVSQRPCLAHFSNRQRAMASQSVSMEVLCQTLEQAAKHRDYEACKKRAHDLESEAAQLEEQTRAKVQKLKHGARLETLKAGNVSTTPPYADETTRQRAVDEFSAKMDELAAEAMIKLQPGNEVWFLESAPGFYRKVKLFSVNVKPAEQGVDLTYLDKETKPVVLKYTSIGSHPVAITSGNGRFKKGDLVDVQFSDAWYEGEVVRVHEDRDLLIKFLLTSQDGHWFRPNLRNVQRRGTFTNGPITKKEDAPKTVAADSEEFQKLYGGGSSTVLPVSLPGKDEATTCRLLQRLFAEKNKPLVFLPPVKTAAELKEDADSDADMVPVSGLEFVSAMFQPGNPALYKGHRCIVHRIFERPDGTVLADVYGPAGPFLGVDANLLTAC